MRHQIYNNLSIALVCATLSLVLAGKAQAKDDILTTAAKNGSFNTLVRLVLAADLDGALQEKGDYTVFAPTDEAFAKLPEDTLASLLKSENKGKLKDILLYHVLGQSVNVPKRSPSHPLKSAATLSGKKVRFQRDGSKVKVNDANIVLRNIKCNNGVIQVIDAVLLPPEDNSIVAVADKAGSFKTLLAAAKAAGLAEALSGDGPFTVFAPTDEAFSKLPKGTINSLLKPENKSKLANILKYHVVKGKVSATAAVRAKSAKTLAGQELLISIEGGQLTINDSKVTANDIAADNGIIHVIDQVLLPPNESNNHDSRDKEKVVEITANWKTPVRKDGIKADVLRIKVTGGGSLHRHPLGANCRWGVSPQ